MSLVVHAAVVAGVFISAWLVKRRASASSKDARLKVDQGPKIGLEQARKEAAEVRNCIYMPSDNQKFSISWGHAKKLILVKGPRNNISHPGLSHEIGHARIYRQNLDKRGKPLAIDCSKNYIMGKLASMFWYEYRVERQAWLLSQYWNTGFSKGALRTYGLMALWDDLDVAASVLFIALLVRLLS